MSQNVVHSDSDLILHNSSVLIDKEPNLKSNFREFQLISEGVASAFAVYTCLERETKVFFTFVPRSLIIMFKICLHG
nr:hypothetical protein [Enterococcus faecium]